MQGNANVGERVVIIDVADGKVNLRTGRIADPEAVFVPADKRTQTIVLGDRPFAPVTDDSGDAYQKAFSVDDIHLLREEEVKTLSDSDAILDWFGSTYQDGFIAEIHRALVQFQAR